MSAAKRILVALIAALAAGEGPRRPGIEGLVPAALYIGALLAIPLYAALVAFERFATRSDPLSGDPALEFAIEAILGALIIGAMMVERWRDDIELQLALYDRLDGAQRRRRRLKILIPGIGLSFALALTLLLALRR
jgi:hypothetical protein